MPTAKTAPAPAGSKKRKAAPTARNPSPSKRSKSQPSPKPETSLIAPHEALIAQLQPKHNVLAASVISSTKIRKRVVQITSHLGCQSELPAVVLLHARTAEVCKMITIVEQCKRILGDRGKSWFQYNQMFDLPARERDVVEEAILDEGQGASSDDDDDGDLFESMASRFEKAVGPAPVSRERTARSMRVFLSGQLIKDLRALEGVTMQSSGIWEVSPTKE
ncbi:hypothetical protein E4U43_001661 [Claviceps pusilla]|uniref:DNA/RNA-binding protein Alba-like domain-containing protein n=1 Tax=Claviceps pusilla TaxID=123648 RepID=A0A9P7SZ24_9HYPO|nr:hypothetical protein E4U43_001661 [Claviceps pusilla]